MGGDPGVDQLGADRPEPFKGAFFVSTDQPRITGNIGRENGSKAAADRHFRQIVKKR
jgi:hypothetical protein